MKGVTRYESLNQNPESLIRRRSASRRIMRADGITQS